MSNLQDPSDEQLGGEQEYEEELDGHEDDDAPEDDESYETEDNDDEDDEEDDGDDGEESEAGSKEESESEEIDSETHAEEAENEEELLVSIEGEEPEPEEKAPRWVRRVQRNSRRLLRENEQLKKKLQEINAPQSGISLATDPGPEPTVEDYDYDPDAFADAYKSWVKKKAEADQYKQRQQEAYEAQRKQFEEFQQRYKKNKASLRASDFADAEEIVQLTLDDDQFNAIKVFAKNPALTIYALGKNPKRLQQLAKDKTMGSFIYQIAEVEGKLKTTRRKPTAPPEKRLKSSKAGTGDMDSKLESARKKAVTSNGIDLTEAIRIRAQQGR